MPPAIVDTMNSFRRQVQAGEDAAVAQMASRWLQVERNLQDSAENTARIILDARRAGRAVTPGMLLRHERFLDLLAQAQTQIRRFAPEAANIITGRQRTLASLGIDHAAQAINTISANAVFNRLPVAALENLIGLAGDGSPLRDLLEDSYGPGADGILDEMVKGVSLGKNPVSIAKAIVRQGLARSLDRMILINRTETLRVYRQASLDSYRASGIVGSYKRIAARSTRTCIGCLAADGRVYPLDTPFDEHPQGRCTMVPVVDGQPEPTWKYGPQWFADQDEAIQREMLGPGRYALYRAGTPFEAFDTRKGNATWGGSIVPTPLRDLQ